LGAVQVQFSRLVFSFMLSKPIDLLTPNKISENSLFIASTYKSNLPQRIAYPSRQTVFFS